jgi:hypothetical protein
MRVTTDFMVFFLIVSRRCPIIVRLSTENENERLFEDFSSVHNSAVFLRILFWKKGGE